MTTRHQARRIGDEARTGEANQRAAEVRSVESPALPDRLRSARERKGVDLYRAERDTKIRARYLAALERGEYKDLPGAVYTKGFLRNYAMYLGLDPEEILGQWRLERGESITPAAPIAVPQPLTAPRQGLTFSPGVIVAALLTVAVVAFIAYLGVQIFRFATPPTLAVTDPATAVLQVDDTTTQYTLTGTTSPGATVEIASSGRQQPYRVTAGADGTWSATVDLQRGRNQFDVTAKDPDTGHPADQSVQRIIMVPFLVIEAPTLTIDSPTDGATYENGAIPVSGSTTNATSVTVAATYLGEVGATPAPSPSPLPSVVPGESPVPSPSPSGPTVQPQTVTPADDGTYSAPVELTTGQWSITVTAASAQGKTVSLTRAVTVNYKGINLVVSVKGGRAWLKVWIDGKLDSTIGAAGRVISDGKTLTFTGQTSVEVRTGNSGVTYFTLNGESLGSLGRNGMPETWLFQPPDPPQKTNRT